jgi:hypothetical protein
VRCRLVRQYDRLGHVELHGAVHGWLLVSARRELGDRKCVCSRVLLPTRCRRRDRVPTGHVRERHKEHDSGVWRAVFCWQVRLLPARAARVRAATHTHIRSEARARAGVLVN